MKAGNLVNHSFEIREVQNYYSSSSELPLSFNTFCAARKFSLHNLMDSQQHVKPSILMLPWLAHGHISPYLELAKKLSKNNFHIYLCSTSINLQFVNQSLEENLSSSSIQLIDLQLPCTLFPELHPHNLTTKNLLNRQLVPTLIAAFDAAKPSFSNILETLKPTVVIYDLFQPWAAEAAHDHDIAAVLFTVVAAGRTSFFMHCAINPTVAFPFPEFDFTESEIQESKQVYHSTVSGITIKDRFLKAMELSSDNLMLIKTSSEIESKYLDYCSSLAQISVFPVGPLVQEPTYEGNDDTKIMDWLNKMEPASVVYVAFGTEYFLSRDEMNEIANGLVLSKVCFIWVVRVHPEQKITIAEALPEGFSEKIEGQGLILEGWAPQAGILAHPSIGGFVSHCGWGSVLEGINFGVPIIAVPRLLEHLSHAKQVVDLGVGMVLQSEKRDKRVTREEVARVIQGVIVEEEGKNMRRKAKEISERMKKRGDTETNVVIEKLMQLVK